MLCSQQIHDVKARQVEMHGCVDTLRLNYGGYVITTFCKMKDWQDSSPILLRPSRAISAILLLR